ncbi:MAG: hypothetical protein P8X42_17450, partial [Calditrichaceae bacterium]
MKAKDKGINISYLLIIVAITFLIPLVSSAQDVFTLNTTSGDWNEATHWDIVRDGDNPGSSTYPGQTAGSADGADSVVVPNGTDVTLDADVP